MNLDNPLLDGVEFYIQNIINNNISLYRAFVNGFYWLKYMFNDIDNRNLGFYSDLQTDISNYLKSKVIDWITDINNKHKIEYIIKYTNIYKKNDFIIKLSNSINTFNDCVLELYILNQLININIIVYNQNNEIIYIFDNGIKYNKKEDKKDKIKIYNDNAIKRESINIRFNFTTNDEIPNNIESLYYK